jgi:hypothetical protein
VDHHKQLVHRRLSQFQESEASLKSQAALAKRWVVVSLALIVVVSLSLLAACSGGSGAGKPDASKADIDKTVTAANWKITLKGVPDVQQIVGGSGVSHQAENGKYIIIPAEVTNTGSDIVLFPDDLIFLKDTAGKQWKLASSTPQFAYKQNHPEVDILMDSPVSPGDTRKTVLIFDVAADSTGFVLTIPGENTVIKLGY